VPAELRIATDAAMRDLGRELAARLRAGDLVILTGPLGAGKTTLVQGIGQGLGVRGPVTSPTFVIARVHPALAGSGPALVHADAYRLGSISEVDDLDLDADAATAVTVIEWGEGLAEGLAEDRLEISIQPDPDGEARTVRLCGHGARWRRGISGKGPASSADRLYSSAVSSVNVRVMQRTPHPPPLPPSCCPCRLHRPLAQAQKACAH
jgi:tRNA threonylcarbamoyladenosine biosynthesis protein TsaE